KAHLRAIRGQGVTISLLHWHINIVCSGTGYASLAVYGATLAIAKYASRGPVVLVWPHFDFTSAATYLKATRSLVAAAETSGPYLQQRLLRAIRFCQPR